MKNDFKFAFIQTIPVMLGYLFMGMAFGILYQKAGYNFIWAFFTALTVYAGSMQFLLVSFLSKGIGLVSAALMTLSVNSRHIFYGLSFIDEFKKTGKAYPYMVFSLTDETYSLLWGTKVPKELNKKRVSLLIAALNQSYWVIGCTVGALLGELITFNVEGIDFAMTALFIVIFVEQWLGGKNHTPAITGALVGVLCIAVLGGGKFLLPALLINVGILVVRQRLSAKEDA